MMVGFKYFSHYIHEKVLLEKYHNIGTKLIEVYNIFIFSWCIRRFFSILFLGRLSLFARLAKKASDEDHTDVRISTQLQKMSTLV